MRRISLILAGVALVIITIVGLISRSDCGPAKPETPDVASSDVGGADAGNNAPDAGAPLLWVSAEPTPGSFVALVDGDPVDDVRFLIGAAGVYPPLEAQGSIALPEPAPTMDGEQLRVVEVYARTPDGAHSYWDDVDVDANAVDLVPSAEVRVQVVDDRGNPVNQAAVRLGRESVGLVMLAAQTGEDGVATFDAVPDGEYVATVKAPGARTASESVTAGTSSTIVVTRGREVAGHVNTPDGKPVAGVIVAIHGAEIGANPLVDVPADIVKTDLLGAYRATGIPGAQVVAVALADGWAPTQSGASTTGGTDPVRLDITLRPGRRVRATVVDEQDRPVRGAKVEWRGANRDHGASLLTDSSGQAWFQGVPGDATMRATMERFESGEVTVDNLDVGDDGTTAIQLRLANADSRRWRIRLLTPADVVLHDLIIRDSAGVRCAVSTSDGRDFVARSCGDGTIVLVAQTNFGEVQWSGGAWVDGLDVKMPDPTDVVVDVSGVDDEDWDATNFTLVRGITSAQLEITERRSGRRLSTRVYPGGWRLVVSNERIGMQPFELTVTDEPLRTSIELVALHLFKVLVVDSYGAPVTGAYAMLFRGDELIDVSRSAGQLPMEFRVRPPFDGKLLVVDPRRGEGRATLSSAGTEGDVRISLREKVLKLDTPPGRPDRAGLAERLGATLTARDAGWVLDFATESPGTRAGLRRGDALVSAWPDGSRMRVIVYRRGEGYVDVAVP